MNEVLIYGDIGWENTAKDIQAQLNGFDNEPVNVRISSPGGDVYEGIAILNVLRAYAGEITVIIDSWAASAAAFIAVGTGGRVICRPNAELMIHRAWSYFDGNADDVLKSHSDLERQDLKQANIFIEKAGGTVDEWLALMSAETWYTADEALAAGLVDEIVDAKESTGSAPAASIKNKRVMAQFKYANRQAAPAPPLNNRRAVAAQDSNQTQGATHMSVLENLEKAITKDPGAFAKALAGFMGEAVEVNGTVDVTYPDSEIAPTEKITVLPVIGEGDGAAGLEFALGDAPEGYTVEIDEAGAVSVTAPAGVEPGDTAAITVNVNDVAIALNLTVRALSNETDTGDTAPAGEPGEAAPAGHAPGDSVTIDAESFAELQAAAKYGWAAKEREHEAALVAEVDKWIDEGRINVRMRAKAIEAMKHNADGARALYGANPAGTIPRREIGHGVDTDEGAKITANKPSPFAKPRI